MNMLHIGAFNSTNAGDTVLLNATHRLFDKMIGEIDWIKMSAWSRVGEDALDWINETNGVVIGGGGLFLKDSRPNVNSGWQWDCSIDVLKKITAPIYVFGVGFNRFRGQGDFAKVFSRHVSLLVEKSKFFGVRNTGSKRELEKYIPKELWDKVFVQPCPSTVLSRIEDYPPVKMEDRVVVNLACDRPELRYRNGIESVVAITEKLKNHASVVYVKHLPIDYPIMGGEEVSLSGKPSFFIIDFYRKTPLTIGTRGHAQMIPFGVGNGIFSIITHNKMTHFLEDIGKPEWGMEADNPRLEERLIEAIKNPDTNGIAEAQDRLWGITLKNFERMLNA